MSIRRSTILIAFAATATVGIVTAAAMTTSAASAQKQGTGMVTAIVHELPRVVVTGHVQRAEAARIIELPRVVVTGRRTELAPTLVTQEAAAPAAQRS